jgi:gamma-glutamyl-gamma-aminobutyraldehyde dehydrogenase
LRTVDLPETINCLIWHAELIDKIYDQVSPASDDHIAMIVREPGGRRGSRPAVELPAADAGVEDRPGAGRGLLGHRETGGGDLADRAPRGGTGDGGGRAARGAERRAGHGAGGGRTAGPAHGCRHGLLHRLDRDGRRFLRYAAESNLKEVTLEMGGKNPAIVLDDAENLDRVAAHVVNGAFWNMGENCSASSRLIVQAKG